MLVLWQEDLSEQEVFEQFYKHLLYLLRQLPVVSKLWLVNLAGCTLLYSPLKFKVDSVAKLFCDLSSTVLNFHSK